MKTLRETFSAATPEGRAAVTSLLMLAALQPLSAPDTPRLVTLGFLPTALAMHHSLPLVPEHRESVSVRLR
jgi:hypothetical protein